MVLETAICSSGHLKEILEESRSESGPTPITDMETATETEVDVGGVIAEGQKLLDGEIPKVILRDMLALP